MRYRIVVAVELSRVGDSARERLLTCEEVFELNLKLPDVVAMQTRQPNLDGAAEIRLRRLVKEVLWMRPDRIMGGEMEDDKTSMLV